MKYKPLESSRSAHRLWKKSALGLLLFGCEHFSLYRKPVKGLESGERSTWKEWTFPFLLGRTLFSGLCFLLAFALTFYLGINLYQITSDLSLANLHRLTNKHNNLTKITSALTLSDVGMWGLLQFLQQAELDSQLSLTFLS